MENQWPWVVSKILFFNSTLDFSWEPWVFSYFTEIHFFLWFQQQAGNSHWLFTNILSKLWNFDQQVKARITTENIMQKLIGRKLRLFGPICRMHSNRRIKELAFGRREGENRRGKPHRNGWTISPNVTGPHSRSWVKQRWTEARCYRFCVSIGRNCNVAVPTCNVIRTRHNEVLSTIN